MKSNKTTKIFDLRKFGDSYLLALKIGYKKFEELHPNNRWLYQIKWKIENN